MIFSACSEERPPLPLLVAPLLAHGAIPPHPLCGSSAPRPSDIKLLQRKSQALEHSSTTRTCPRGSILTQFTCPQSLQQRPRVAAAPCVLSVPCSHLGLRTQVPSNKMLRKIQLLSLVGFSGPHPVHTVPIPPPLDLCGSAPPSRQLTAGRCAQLPGTRPHAARRRSPLASLRLPLQRTPLPACSARTKGQSPLR